jgi:hypothetical protein
LKKKTQKRNKKQTATKNHHQAMQHPPLDEEMSFTDSSASADASAATAASITEESVDERIEASAEEEMEAEAEADATVDIPSEPPLATLADFVRVDLNASPEEQHAIDSFAAEYFQLKMELAEWSRKVDSLKVERKALAAQVEAYMREQDVTCVSVTVRNGEGETAREVRMYLRLVPKRSSIAITEKGVSSAAEGIDAHALDAAHARLVAASLKRRAKAEKEAEKKRRMDARVAKRSLGKRKRTTARGGEEAGGGGSSAPQPPPAIEEAAVRPTVAEVLAEALDFVTRAGCARQKVAVQITKSEERRSAGESHSHLLPPEMLRKVRLLYDADQELQRFSAEKAATSRSLDALTNDAPVECGSEFAGGGDAGEEGDLVQQAIATPQRKGRRIDMEKEALRERHSETRSTIARYLERIDIGRMSVRLPVADHTGTLRNYCLKEKFSHRMGTFPASRYRATVSESIRRVMGGAETQPYSPEAAEDILGTTHVADVARVVGESMRRFREQHRVIRRTIEFELQAARGRSINTNKNADRFAQNVLEEVGTWGGDGDAHGGEGWEDTTDRTREGAGGGGEGGGGGGGGGREGEEEEEEEAEEEEQDEEEEGMGDGDY